MYKVYMYDGIRTKTIFGTKCVNKAYSVLKEFNERFKNNMYFMETKEKVFKYS